MDALDIFPPEVQDDENRKNGGEVILGEHQGMMEIFADVFDKAREILARGNRADGPGQYVVKQQSAETENFASVPPMASLTTRYTPPRTNMLLDSM